MMLGLVLPHNASMYLSGILATVHFSVNTERRICGVSCIPIFSDTILKLFCIVLDSTENIFSLSAI